MTTNEYIVYNEIKKRSEMNLWTSVQLLADLVKTDKRSIRRYIKNIRENATIQKIIITDYQKGYKLMSENDEFEILEKTKSKILKQLKRYWLDVERYNHNNQNKITVTKYERDFYKSLLESKGENDEM